MFPPVHDIVEFELYYDKYDNNFGSNEDMRKYNAYLYKNKKKIDWISPLMKDMPPLGIDDPVILKIDMFNVDLQSIYSYIYRKILDKLPPWVGEKNKDALDKSNFSNKSHRQIKEYFYTNYNQILNETKQKLFQLSLVKKFEDTEMKKLLIKTGTKPIKYTSADLLFGTGRGKGTNIIGRIYELIRNTTRTSYINLAGEKQVTIPVLVLQDDYIYDWVKLRIENFTMTINMVKNEYDGDYLNIIKEIYSFCKFKKDKKLKREYEINKNRGRAEEIEKTRHKYVDLYTAFLVLINQDCDAEITEAEATRLFEHFLLNSFEILDVYVKNLDIKEVTDLKHQLHLVEIHDFFEYSLNKQLYNYIMNMYKKGDDLDTILNTFLYIDKKDGTEIKFNAEKKKDYDKKFKTPKSEFFIRVKKNIEAKICVCVYFIIENCQVNSIKQTIGFLENEIYKKYIIASAVVEIANIINTKLNNTIELEKRLLMAGEILIKDKIFLEDDVGDELFSYENTDFLSEYVLDNINLPYADFYFGADIPIFPEIYKDKKLTDIVNVIYNSVLDKKININRIICFAKNSE